MRFVSFKKDGKSKLGVRTGAGVVDLSVVDKKIATDLKELIGQGFHPFFNIVCCS